MTALGILVLFSLAGIGVAFWLLKNDRESAESTLSEALDLAEETEDRLSPKPPLEPVPIRERQPGILKKLMAFKKKGPGKQDEAENEEEGRPQEASPKSKNPFEFLTGLAQKLHLADLFNKIPFLKKEPDDGRETTPLPSLKEFFQDEEASEEPLTGTASLKTIPAEEPVDEKIFAAPKEEKKNEKETALAAQLNTLQEKYERLDVLFKEKSAELQETKASLENEIKNRKEFEKIKSLLEQEIQSTKEKTRSVQTEGENTRSEIERAEKRSLQLEEKIGQLEQELLEKEGKIDDLLKRLQTFASPSTAAVPPTMEGIKQEPVSKPAPPESPSVLKEIPLSEEEPKEDQDFDGPRERGEDISLREDPPKTGPVPNRETAQTNGSFEAEPPEPYDEPPEDASPQEGGFLKLQPDILSEGPEEKGLIASEIERSLESPPDFEIKPDPGQPPKTNNGPSKDEEIIKIVDPQDEPPASLKDAQEEKKDNNTDNPKE